MKCHTLIFQKLEKMSQNLSPAAVVIGALRANPEKNLFADKNKAKKTPIMYAHLPIM